jgi:uncharacterized protein
LVQVANEVRIAWPGGEVSGIEAGSGKVGVLVAHGAGTNQRHRFIVGLRDGLAAAGYRVLTFNYPYTERGSKRPDRPEVLIPCHRAAADFLGAQVDTLVLAGRSMGGRMGTMLAAEGYQASGLVLYSYPLHPPGKPESLRVEHLPRIEAPMLFFQGTRDALSRMDLFERYVSPLPNVTVELLEGASHSFSGGGWTEQTLLERLVIGTKTWIGHLSSGTTRRRGA